MKRKRSSIARLLCLIASPISVVALADSAFDCKPTVNGKQFDLTFMDGYSKIENTVSTFPTTTKTEYLVSLCSPLPHFKHLSDDDQCPKGTRICMTVSNHRSGSDDRIISVMPLSGEIGYGPLEVEAGSGKVEEGKTPAPLVLTLHGGYYEKRNHSTEITFVCDKDAKEVKTTFQWYSSYYGKLYLTWATDKVCNQSQDPPSNPPKQDPPAPQPPPPDRPPDQQQPPNGGNTETHPPQQKTTSLLDIIETALFVLGSGLLAYFIIGASVLRTQYGATGLDLVPHRYFWQDLPYVLRDLCARGSRSSRGSAGYSSL